MCPRNRKKPKPAARSSVLDQVCHDGGCQTSC